MDLSQYSPQWSPGPIGYHVCRGARPPPAARAIRQQKRDCDPRRANSPALTSPSPALCFDVRGPRAWHTAEGPGTGRGCQWRRSHAGAGPPARTNGKPPTPPRRFPRPQKRAPWPWPPAGQCQHCAHRESDREHHRAAVECQQHAAASEGGACFRRILKWGRAQSGVTRAGSGLMAAS